MNVFIEPNVFVDCFRMSSDDLDELQKLSQRCAAGEITLFVSDIVQDVFSRKREQVIADAMKMFRGAEVQPHVPSIAREHPNTAELRQLRDRTRRLVDAISADVQQQSRRRELKADLVINELFEQAGLRGVKKPIIHKARKRREMGKPPQSDDSLEVAIHWEWLLKEVPDHEDLYLVSRNGGFVSPLHSDQLSEYLAREWTSRKKSECVLHRTLEVFFRQQVPHIRLADECTKAKASQADNQSVQAK